MQLYIIYPTEEKKSSQNKYINCRCRYEVNKIVFSIYSYDL